MPLPKAPHREGAEHDLGPRSCEGHAVARLHRGRQRRGEVNCRGVPGELGAADLRRRRLQAASILESAGLLRRGLPRNGAGFDLALAPRSTEGSSLRRSPDWHQDEHHHFPRHHLHRSSMPLLTRPVSLSAASPLRVSPALRCSGQCRARRADVRPLRTPPSASWLAEVALLVGRPSPS